ncbi:hypothetical protein PO909_020922 [Leuciscus waleckii]
MKQTDIKRVLAIFVGALSTLCVETCPENHFQLPDLQCCLNCPGGWYVVKNCSDRPGVYIGVDCNKCRRCEEIGQITVSNCTQFADTQCAMARLQKKQNKKEKKPRKGGDRRWEGHHQEPTISKARESMRIIKQEVTRLNKRLMKLIKQSIGKNIEKSC